jgi:hypothetical protein
MPKQFKWRKPKPAKEQALADSNQNVADQYRRQISGDLHVRGEVEAKFPPSLVEKYDCAQQEESTYKRRMFTVEVITMAAVIAYAGLALWQGRLTREAITNSSKQFQADQRPILWVTNDTGTPQVYVNPKDPTTGQILWTWHFTNYGKTPVSELRFRQYMKLGDGDFVPSNGEKEEVFGAPIPAGKVDTDTVISRELKVSEINDLIQSGGVTVKIIIEYTDAYKSRYETKVCMNRTNAGSIAYCKDENYIH